MSVNRSNARSSAWEDYEHSLHNINLSIPDQALSGGQGFYKSNKTRMEPAGGLHRGEVAELVAVDIQHHEAEVSLAGDDTFGTQPGWASFETQPAREVFRFEEPLEAENQNSITNNTQVSDDGIDTLFFCKSYATQNFFDGSNPSVSGNGAFEMADQRLLKFRNDYGMGPLFFENDEVQYNCGFNVQQITTDQVNGRAEFRYVWDVMEASELPDQYLPSRLL